jgi:hypothetical protein
MSVGSTRVSRADSPEAPSVSPSVRPRGAPQWIVAALTLAVSGCTTFSSSFAVIENQLAAQQFGPALQTLEKQGYAQRDEVLYLLNQGMLRRMNGDYAGSNLSLEAAKGRMDALYATSVTETTLTFVVNDATQSYVGEEHEQVLVHLYKALNYLELHQLNEARVEALQVDIRLREIGGKFSGAQYTEDAFARYLTGMIYEELEEWSDALIAYRKAYEAYQNSAGITAVPVPRALQYDLLRMTQRQGLTAERNKYRKEFGITQWSSVAERREQGELVFILHNGLAPIKRERSVAVPDPSINHIIRVSLPYYESHPVMVTGARVSARALANPGQTESGLAESSASTELMEDIDAIARKNLSAKLPGITVRAVARAAAKRAISRAAQQAARSSNDRNDAMAALILGFGVEVTTILTERADTRSWLTLPHDIRLARLPLPPGMYMVRVDFLGYGDQAIATREYPVTIERGRKQYISYHYIGASYPAARR